LRVLRKGKIERRASLPAFEDCVAPRNYRVGMLDSPVSGGPSGAASGKMAIWVGGDEQIFDRHKPVPDAMGHQAALYRALSQESRSSEAGGQVTMSHGSASYRRHRFPAEIIQHAIWLISASR
jgi:6-phosphogluconate dehydrogenase (decarboxylating)